MDVAAFKVAESSLCEALFTERSDKQHDRIGRIGSERMSDVRYCSYHCALQFICVLMSVIVEVRAT